MSKKENVRINIYTSNELVDFYEVLAKKMGLSRSAAMVSALYNQMVQIRAAEIGSFAVAEMKAEKRLLS